MLQVHVTVMKVADAFNKRLSAEQQEATLLSFEEVLSRFDIRTSSPDEDDEYFRWRN